MLFNSFIFVAFFIIVYLLYLNFRTRFRFQNCILLVASYIFYGYWDVRFLLLLLISTVVDFWVGLQIEKTDNGRSRRSFLAISIIINLTILGFFKYFNFFSESVLNLLSILGMDADPITLDIILPIGISFYTFQTLSYSIDIYRRKIRATHNFLDFALFVSFFPQLVAGPIERASTLLPQISTPRSLNVDQINAGLFLILWGYFKKMAIADNVGGIADTIFENYTDFQGLDLWIGAFAFTIQIYGDFSGYSDIARGLAKLMGFELMVNFNLPYFSTNPSQFWARWHISLSTWFRDYVYIPLGGNRGDHLTTYRNLAITMVLCGLWHGAAWTFILWGIFHGLLLITYRVIQHHFVFALKWFKPYSQITAPIEILIMMFLTVLGWILFRSSTLQQVVYIMTHLSLSLSPDTGDFAYDLLFYSMPLIAVQLWQFKSQDLLVLTKLNSWLRIPLYGCLLATIVVFSNRDTSEFIYFQF